MTTANSLTRRAWLWLSASPVLAAIATRAPLVLDRVAVRFVRYSPGSKVGTWIGWLENRSGQVVGFVRQHADGGLRVFRMKPGASPDASSIVNGAIVPRHGRPPLAPPW